MAIVAIIQARMGSTRLPGKVLLPLAGRPVITRVIERVQASGVFDDVVVATTTLPRDDDLAEVAASSDVRIVRGGEADVLGRYAVAANESGASAIMRITADCPLIDPSVLKSMVSLYRNASSAVHLATNARVRSYPRGLDAEIFSREALDTMHREAQAPHQREHVTPFLYEHPERFRILDVVHDRDLSDLRWTLDTPEDFELLKRIFAASPNPDDLDLAEVVTILSAHPDWARLNADIKQKEI